jgi:hypothetical protein
MKTFKKSLTITSFVVLPLVIIDYAELGPRIIQLIREFTLFTFILLILPSVFLLFRRIYLESARKNSDCHSKHSNLRLFYSFGLKNKQT